MPSGDKQLEALLVEHEQWAKAHKSEWRQRHPMPVGAWDGNSWHRQFENWNQWWISEVRPLANQWWASRCYVLRWSDCGAVPERIATV